MTRISAPFLSDPGLRRVMDALTGDGHQALIVGGAVRNALMGVAVSDTDIATSARPDRVIHLAEAAGLRAVPTGIAHGTITVVADGKGYEVTTFRRDVETDGRRAVVAFSDDIAEDAQRRDFTMNALYCDADGRVLDPVGGLPDLAARRLRFVGDAHARIAEDFLRILRFFRFHAWYGAPGQADPDALAACRDGVAGLTRISHERIGAEMRKLLSAPDPSEALALMAQGGALAAALPGADARNMPALVEAEHDFGHGALPKWPRRLALLNATDPANALRLSRDEARMQQQLQQAIAMPAPEAAYRMGRAIAAQATLIRAARGDAPLFGWCHAIAQAAEAKFPLAAQDLMGQVQGPALGDALRRAEDAFIASGFALSRDDLRQLALEHPAKDQG